MREVQRMRSFSAIVAICLAVMMSAPAAAQEGSSAAAAGGLAPSTLTPIDIPDATADFHQDAAGGTAVSDIFRDIKNANALRTTLSIVGFHNDPKWFPRVKIAVLTSRARDGEQAALLFDAPRNDKINAHLDKIEGTKVTATGTFRDLFEKGQAIDIAMDWDDKGGTVIKVGNAPPLKVILKVPITEIVLSISSCEAQFSPLLIAHAN